MSDRVERAVEAVNGTQPITRLVNSEMTREEQVQFARTLWEGGTNPRSSAPGVWTRDVGGAEVTFRTVNGERQVSDIVVNGRDIYDTPEETRGRQYREQAATARANQPVNRGIGSDGRYTSAPETRETAEAARARQDYERCVDGSGNRSSRLERAVCSDTAGHSVPGDQRQPVQERTVVPSKTASKSMSFSLPQLELI